ncbi:MAG: DEAD/DEAH box helicase [Bacteroidota bacterium]
MKFENYRISPDIKKSIAKLGFRRPTDIQFKAIPNILKGEDLLAIAQTGTGKTAAFAIPVLSILHDKKQGRQRPDGIKCLVMVPTRELAIQINEVFTELGRHTKVKSFALFGGVEQDAQITKLQKGIDILMATPGRMFDLIAQKHLNLERVEMLILDEADHMLDLGFIKDIRDVLGFLPKKRQTLFFSATIDEKIKKIAYSLVNKSAIRIQISPKDPVSKRVDHFVTFMKMDDKRFFLERLVNQNPAAKILVFVRTKVRAERVAKAMARVDINATTIHGDKGQKDRLRVLDQFKKGQTKVLIATDVSARGIDIPNVGYVVNYDLPEQAENYVHRIGRTGRGSNRGYAIAFCSPDEKPYLEAIEAYISKPVTVLAFDRSDYDATITFSADATPDWEQLKAEMEAFEEAKRGKGKRKKGK